jgi:hypothetical protein
MIFFPLVDDTFEIEDCESFWEENFHTHKLHVPVYFLFISLTTVAQKKRHCAFLTSETTETSHMSPRDKRTAVYKIVLQLYWGVWFL